ncbi:MAG: ATP-dependent helicase [Thermotogae bacterium]|nr:ATP-dependent helicase [Thermotogota bacterium]MCP5465723.1 ATP-dependent helicase [Thermotogota bacterium]
MNSDFFEIKIEEPGFIKEDLDEEQYEAVKKSDGKSLIIAGPGSGKTRVITYKIAYLLYSGISPENILLVTFTRAASKEMIKRVKNVTNINIDSMTAGTFHHVCNMILRKYAARIGYKNNFTILDYEDSKDLMKIARNEYKENFSDDRELPKESVVLKIISFASNSLKSLRESIMEVSPYLIEHENAIEDMWVKYNELKRDINAMDYDDILVNTAMLLSTNKDVLNNIASRYKYVLVDEFQDTNKIQLDIIEALSSVHKNLIAVGDDAQSIYSFRGARFENVQDFINDDKTKLFKIQTNYRSTPEIVELVNEMIPEKSVPKRLKSIRKEYMKPTIIETFDDMEQCDAVAQLIENKFDEGINADEIAVLYRSHSLSMTLQQKLDSKRISYRLLSGKRFIETAHIKDILAFLKIVQNPLDKISWMRILKLFPGVGTKTASNIFNKIFSGYQEGTALENIIEKVIPAKHKNIIKIIKNIYLIKNNNPYDIIKFVFDEFYAGYSGLNFKDSKSRNMDIERFMDIAANYKTLEAFLEEMTLSENIEIKNGEKDQKEDQVTLTTVHGAKGLEWKVVIIISVNPGDFPNGMALKEKKIEEEERLFYVAITRAKNELYILKQTTGAVNPYMRNSFLIYKKENDFIQRIDKNYVEILKLRYS